MITLIHTSKTMRPATEHKKGLTTPEFIDEARQLAQYLKTLSDTDVEKVMKVSAKLAGTTTKLIDSWTDASQRQRAAIDSFLGDIYSGLQVADFTDADRAYVQNHLRILSGLYGVLRPLDGIYPYRFEMGYKVPDLRYKDLYAFWGTKIFDSLPKNETIIDLTAVEYGKTVTKYAKLSENSIQIVTPRFLTISPKTGEPTFVVVHAKIARGAFAHWLMKSRIETTEQLKEFQDIGYRYDATLSTEEQPVFVAKEFQGLGLSVRLT